MNLSPINWQQLQITADFPKNYSTSASFLDFQPLAKQALENLVRGQIGEALVLKTETLPEYLQEIEAYLRQYDLPLVSKTEFNAQTLFGYELYLEKTGKTEQISGAIQAASSGVLLLNVNALLLDLRQWDKLKQALLFGAYELPQANSTPNAASQIRSPFKLLLVGSRDDLSLLFQYDDNLYQFAHYAEVESYLTLDDENLIHWGNYVSQQAQKMGKSLSPQAVLQLLNAYVRESETQELISISPTLLKKQLQGIANFYPNQTAYDDIQGYLDYVEQQSSVLNRYSMLDMLSQQIHIETYGEEIGQINGLSVVEFDGVPHSFGEPIRISCNVQYGEGEIHDLERKVELGGSLHAKGIMIAQSCLSNLLELPTQLPFSATLAFEQSYGEVDGDSSALAIFCVLISSLTKLPIPQHLALTGSLDQFGNVLSVGGVNQKIEGFFQLCEARGFTGKQGVIIPAACLSHLSLKPVVIEAVEAGQFHIWAVENVFEALYLLFNHAFYDEDLPKNSEQSSLFALVHQGIDQNEKSAASGSILQKIYQLLKRN